MRSVARTAYSYLASLFLVGVIIEFFLAGLGVFRTQAAATKAGTKIDHGGVQPQFRSPRSGRQRPWRDQPCACRLRDCSPNRTKGSDRHFRIAAHRPGAIRARLLRSLLGARIASSVGTSRPGRSRPCCVRCLAARQRTNKRGRFWLSREWHPSSTPLHRVMLPDVTLSDADEGDVRPAGKHPRLHQLTLLTPILATRARIARRAAHPMVHRCGLDDQVW